MSMTNAEQKCGQCMYFKQRRSQDNLTYNRGAAALELLLSGDPGQLASNTGICEAPYETFNGKKQAPGFTTFPNQNCGAQDSNQNILFQPKE